MKQSVFNNNQYSYWNNIFDAPCYIKSKEHCMLKFNWIVTTRNIEVDLINLLSSLPLGNWSPIAKKRALNSMI